jgi:glycosyl-4,4'-diaponeurosporenoate acyltransferase
MGIFRRIAMDDSLINNLIVFLLLSIINTLMSFVAPLKLLNPCNWIFRPKAWECEGAIYQKLFRIKKWKNALPELGDFIKGVFHKKKLQRFELEYLRTYIVESCRAELTHESIILTSLLFPLWAEPTICMPIIYISLLLNTPFIMIQRHNRPRIMRMLEKTKPLFELAEDLTVQ